MASKKIVIKNLSNDEQTRDFILRNLCKCTSLNIKLFKYEGLHEP